MQSNEGFPRIRHLFARVATPRRPRRALVLVRGPDTTPFLHGLCTAHLTRYANEQGPVCTSTCFLDRRGRMLFEALVWIHGPERVYLDIDGRVMGLALRHLTLHRMRARVAWEHLPATLYVEAFAHQGSGSNTDTRSGTVKQVETRVSAAGHEEMHAIDPRSPVLGMRRWQCLTSTPACTTMPGTGQHKRCYHSYWLAEAHRVLHAIPQGIQDVVPGQSLPLECNFEQLGAIAFDKGCYLGQELTARTHYTGVIRKRTVAGILSPDATDALQRAEAAAAFLQRPPDATLPPELALLFPSEVLAWPGPALKQQLLRVESDTVERPQLEPVASAATQKRSVATLGTIIANLATALVPLADTDLHAAVPGTQRLLRVSGRSPASIANWYFAWWIPPYLQAIASSTSVSPVSSATEES